MSITRIDVPLTQREWITLLGSALFAYAPPLNAEQKAAAASHFDGTEDPIGGDPCADDGDPGTSAVHAEPDAPEQGSSGSADPNALDDAKLRARPRHRARHSRRSDGEGSQPRLHEMRGRVVHHVQSGPIHEDCAARVSMSRVRIRSVRVEWLTILCAALFSCSTPPPTEREEAVASHLDEGSTDPTPGGEDTGGPVDPGPGSAGDTDPGGGGGGGDSPDPSPTKPTDPGDDGVQRFGQPGSMGNEPGTSPIECSRGSCSSCINGQCKNVGSNFVDCRGSLCNQCIGGVCTSRDRS
jgi:hypothetical protein